METKIKQARRRIIQAYRLYGSGKDLRLTVEPPKPWDISYALFPEGKAQFRFSSKDNTPDAIMGFDSKTRSVRDFQFMSTQIYHRKENLLDDLALLTEDMNRRITSQKIEK
jgi:hypothetical protein